MAHVLRDIANFSFAMTVKKVRKATYYIDEKTVVKMTANHRPRGRAYSLHFSVTVGGPNYAERQFIKLCKKAGEPLPVKKVQLTYWKKK